jgi:simple sugar transport system substrate-binding protein
VADSLKYLVVAIIVAVIASVATYLLTSGEKDTGNFSIEDVKDFLSDADKVEVNESIQEIDIDILKDLGYAKETIKAGFIYVGPVGDLGWTAAHDQARLIVEDKFNWLDSVIVESVSLGDAPGTIDRLVDEDCDIIFTTSFDFMDPTFEKASEYPETIFMHCSGYKRAENMGTYFADFYQLYYLNGLMAGALTQSNKLGYIGAHPIPEVYRHINAFALGAKEVNPAATVEVVWINDWYNPTKAKTAAETLIGKGIDVLAFTEDSATVVQEAEAATNAGNRVLSFSHYSPMGEFGPNSCVSGQIAHWEDLYELILQRVYTGTWDNRDYDYLLAEGGVELGAKMGEPINPNFVDNLKAVKVTDDLLGEISVYDLVMKRVEQFTQTSVAFDPFTGPIYDQAGTLKFADGERASYIALYGDSMNWFVDNIVG